MVMADDYYRVLVTLQHCSVSISQAEGPSPPPGKTHLDLIWGKICLLREKEGRLVAGETVVWLEPLDLIWPAIVSLTTCTSSYFGR